ncbi:MAG: response regulator [Candidatus Celaenobacter antarcticus]|nr:response regulator [Candidatus Celaenobacter antarcticus]
MIRILIVDDDKDLCKIFSDILKEEGYFIKIAYDGESAIKKLKDKKYNLMVLDYKLKNDKNGLQVLEEAKQIDPSLITIMISAYGNKEIRARAKKLGAYSFLDKPFNIKKLINVANKALIHYVIMLDKL